MRLFGWDITVTKTPVAPTGPPTGWDYSFGSPFWGSSWGGSWPTIQEPFTGAWQRNMEQRPDSYLTNFAVYACVSLIASDISKIRLRLMEADSRGIAREVDTSPFLPVIRKPNHYQNRIKFIESWVVSKVTRGNAYILKERDDRNMVRALYPLDPGRVRPLVSSDGSVFYELGGDRLSGVPDGNVAVPASEIIHDVMVPLYHPLCGVSPLVACAWAALQSSMIQASSTKFFANGSNPGGVLTAPGKIPDATAKRIKEYWEQNYTGGNVGKVAVLGDGLKYEAMHINAQDSQLIEQLKWTAEQVAACYHVPLFMIGLGATPAYNNIEALKEQYYSQCLQVLMESIELCFDEGLGLPDTSGKTYFTQFDLADLLRMDTMTKVESVSKSIGGGFMSPNEGRAKFDLPPVDGGESPYLQQQNYSLAALKRRDETQPLTTPGTAPPTDDDDDDETADDGADEVARQILARVPYVGLDL